MMPFFPKLVVEHAVFVLPCCNCYSFLIWSANTLLRYDYYWWANGMVRRDYINITAMVIT